MTTPEELSNAVKEVVALAQERVGPDSIGAQQYYVEGEPQKFETMTLSGFLVYTREEALDIINYGVMLVLKIDQIGKMAERFENPFMDVGIEDECGEKKFLSVNLGTVICAYPKGHEGSHSFDEQSPI